jgi:hypothetical protein
MVSVYKKPVGSPLHPDNKVFNMNLAKPHVSSQHTIGILKGRVPFLWSIWMRLMVKKTRSQHKGLNSVTTILPYVVRFLSIPTEVY